MGSSYRSKSTHMSDIKGKGILYEDDDELIKLTDHDISQNINEFKLSLIGKILNLKKQSVEKLLQKFPVQWGMEERITANDLGNGKFLLNFTTKDDLNSVLRQGPFHFNFCMFVLLIPFWDCLIGVPLHLWTENNLKEIGSRLGHVHQDTIELIEGRMLLDIDSRRPLKFTRKAESPKGDEVTIEIKYEMLFKHSSTYGMLTHEKEYCPSLHRQGVFTRVQLQEHQPQQQLVNKEYRTTGTPRSLAFNTLTEQDPKPTTEDDQVIEAINDMDITNPLDGGLMDCEMQNDDLMGLEVAEMEDKTGQDRAGHVAVQKA
uniref:DUF4283 domain-containing protein n=1 Tax=Brassica oleracea var. oleracea TaxID=109376 RepID=A0A0D3BXW4_BRAOL